MPLRGRALLPIPDLIHLAGPSTNCVSASWQSIIDFDSDMQLAGRQSAQGTFVFLTFFRCVELGVLMQWIMPMGTVINATELIPGGGGVVDG